MNHVTLSGNVTREPEVFSPEGSEWSCIKFGIANNDERRKDQAGNWESIVSFFDAEFWTKKPGEWLQRIHKGDQVFVEARMKQETWDQDGTKRSRVKLNITGFPYCFQKHGTSQASSQPPQKEDDIPF